MNISNLIRQHWAALRALLVLTVITGFIYPAVIWLVAMLPGLHAKAEGSIITVAGKPSGSKLNIMHLQTPQSAILSAVIFNALIIVGLIPLALRGVGYKAMSAEALLQRNLIIYGFGGIIAPFLGIKLIDIIITAIHLA